MGDETKLFFLMYEVCFNSLPYQTQFTDAVS